MFIHEYMHEVSYNKHTNLLQQPISHTSKGLLSSRLFKDVASTVNVVFLRIRFDDDKK